MSAASAAVTLTNLWDLPLITTFSNTHISLIVNQTNQQYNFDVNVFGDDYEPEWIVLDDVGTKSDDTSREIPDEFCDDQGSKTCNESLWIGKTRLLNEEAEMKIRFGNDDECTKFVSFWTTYCINIKSFI